ncbi:hypothetical protein GTP91_25815 [Rugamonas sp. FT82W]|uniref:Uncharacterized protein n=1 Tax=Duganella vulcania TaxID=2692166 RepID=A0A845GCI2_9BURK|nr:hypothetical protein [Duganella vulcania]MYM90577.1 hypothetical protein [Duganella vulcania]
MSKPAAKPAPQFLLRLRERDTPTGVSEATVEKLMKVTGLTKTEVAHLALKQMAGRYLPFYEQDDGPLTIDQIRAIRQASSASDTPEEQFTQRIF